MVKAVLSDIDGTLVDSNYLHAKAWVDAFAAAGIPLTEREAWSQIGKGGDQLMPVFIKDEVQCAAIQEPLETYRTFIFHHDYMAQVKPFDQAHAMLQHMHDAGLRVALSSSASTEDLKVYKKMLGIDDIVDTYTTADDTERSKPHPDIFAATLDKLGLAADVCVALGDTPYDAEAATKCGLRIVGVTCGGWSEADLRKAGCVEVYRDPADLLARFSQSLFVTG
jgi:HAD superfamily hydrolase (TIGR01509 family)